MTECIFAGICIILAWIHAEPMWTVASAIFSLSSHVCDLKRMGGK